ncbi:hypothetical protein BKA65DRAFT_255386 [Rhexocercosporidium sp. MPI-PUGE-AT-0058]|nr:hypothetical protein BKA65DRAFT_255386 [Rhexocercosporidium sp. MPI-PUGE-AT-0058]
MKRLQFHPPNPETQQPLLFPSYRILLLVTSFILHHHIFCPHYLLLRMAISHSKLPHSLLLLTYTTAVLACGSVSPHVELVRRGDYCDASSLSLLGGERICPLWDDIYLRENSSAASDQVNFATDTEDFEDTSIAPTSPFYTIVPIPSKGLGLIATVPIPRGTHLIHEVPLLTIPLPPSTPSGISLPSLLSSLLTAFHALLPSSQKIYLSLHNHRFPGDSLATPPNPDILTIFRSNAYNTGTSHIGLFPLIARINHSCRPNAVNYWSERLGKRVIYAGRDIAVGEEITVAYIPLLKSTKERQQRLGQYGFVCGCEACVDSDGDTSGGNSKSSKRRGKIADLLEVLEQKVEVRSEKKVVNERLAKRAERLVELVREEALVDYLARAYRFVAVFEGRSGKTKEARSWAEREVEELRLAGETEEVERAMKFLEGLGR